MSREALNAGEVRKLLDAELAGAQAGSAIWWFGNKAAAAKDLPPLAVSANCSDEIFFVDCLRHFMPCACVSECMPACVRSKQG